MSIKDF